jgi:hypothetical protein
MLHPSIHAKRFEFSDILRSTTDAAERAKGEFKSGVDRRSNVSSVWKPLTRWSATPGAVLAEVTARQHVEYCTGTHGGQIRVPGIGIIRNATKAPLRWSYGLIEYLYVTSGIGTSGVPVRWGVPPEFVVVDVLGKS